MKKYLTLTFIIIAIAVSAKAEIVGGATVGYLNDSKEGYYTARLGYQFKSAGTAAHIVELEVGYSSDSDAGAKISLVPVTLNYRTEIPTSENWGVYLGAGLGQGNVKVRYWAFNGSDWTFVGQAFAGVSYKISDSAKLTLGARYVSFDNVDFLGSSIEVGDDVSFELGLGFKF